MHKHFANKILLFDSSMIKGEITVRHISTPCWNAELFLFANIERNLFESCPRQNAYSYWSFFTIIEEATHTNDWRNFETFSKTKGNFYNHEYQQNGCKVVYFIIAFSLLISGIWAATRTLLCFYTISTTTKGGVSTLTWTDNSKLRLW